MARSHRNAGSGEIVEQSLAALLTMQPDADHLIVGYSGGLDSQVLLHGLATGRQRWPERRLEAIYIDHGLQAASVAWGEHCARICQALDVPFRIMRIDARPASGESPEAAARQARYAVFAAALGPNSALLTAHHRDDQAETLLLQLLRGAGPHGLAAMPAVSRLGEGRLLRPFLDRDRAELLAYAREHGLHWIEDASNTDIDFDRNYLRHRVLPLLRDRWPAANRTLARSARLCAETAAWLDEQAAADLVDVATDRPDCLSISGLGRLSEQRQRHVLRHWLRQLQLPIPDARQLRHLLQDTLTAAADRNPWVRWPGGEGRRYRDALYALSPLPLHDARQTYVWPSNADGWPPLDLAGVGQLRMQATIGTGLRAAGLSGGSLIVGFRQGGERFRPAGRAHGQELKKLLQEAGIPPWERDRLPLIYLPLASHRLASQLLPSREEGERLPEGCLLLAVVGLGVAAEAAAGPGELGWQPFV